MYGYGFGFGLICVIGAAVRLLFYRIIIGRKDITMKHLTGKKDEQQITSLVSGFLVLFLFIFAITKLV